MGCANTKTIEEQIMSTDTSQILTKEPWYEDSEANREWAIKALVENNYGDEVAITAAVDKWLADGGKFGSYRAFWAFDKSEILAKL